jgi:hypothetical protein
MLGNRLAGFGKVLVIDPVNTQEFLILRTWKEFLLAALSFWNTALFGLSTPHVMLFVWQHNAYTLPWFCKEPLVISYVWVRVYLRRNLLPDSLRLAPVRTWQFEWFPRSILFALLCKDTRHRVDTMLSISAAFLV